MFGLGFRLAFVVDGMDDHLAAGRVDGHVQRARKRRPLLHELIADHAEHPALRERRSLVAHRAVLEAEDQVKGDAIAANGLRLLAASDEASVNRPQGEKAVVGPLDVTNRDRVGPQPGRLQQHRRRDNDLEAPKPHDPHDPDASRNGGATGDLRQEPPDREP